MKLKAYLYYIETELTLQRVDTDQTKGVKVQLLVSPLLDCSTND